MIIVHIIIATIIVLLLMAIQTPVPLICIVAILSLVVILQQRLPKPPHHYTGGVDGGAKPQPRPKRVPRRGNRATKAADTRPGRRGASAAGNTRPGRRDTSAAGNKSSSPKPPSSRSASRPTQRSPNNNVGGPASICTTAAPYKIPYISRQTNGENTTDRNCRWFALFSNIILHVPYDDASIFLTTGDNRNNRTHYTTHITKAEFEEYTDRVIERIKFDKFKARLSETTQNDKSVESYWQEYDAACNTKALHDQTWGTDIDYYTDKLNDPNTVWPIIRQRSSPAKLTDDDHARRTDIEGCLYKCVAHVMDKIKDSQNQKYCTDSSPSTQMLFVIYIRNQCGIAYDFEKNTYTVTLHCDYELMFKHIERSSITLKNHDAIVKYVESTPPCIRPVYMLNYNMQLMWRPGLYYATFVNIIWHVPFNTPKNHSIRVDPTVLTQYKKTLEDTQTSAKFAYALTVKIEGTYVQEYWDWYAYLYIMPYDDPPTFAVISANIDPPSKTIAPVKVRTGVRTSKKLSSDDIRDCTAIAWDATWGKDIDEFTEYLYTGKNITKPVERHRTDLDETAITERIMRYCHEDKSKFNRIYKTARAQYIARIMYIERMLYQCIHVTRLAFDRIRACKEESWAPGRKPGSSVSTIGTQPVSNLDRTTNKLSLDWREDPLLAGYPERTMSYALYVNTNSDDKSLRQSSRHGARYVRQLCNLPNPVKVREPVKTTTVLDPLTVRTPLLKTSNTQQATSNTQQATRIKQ